MPGKTTVKTTVAICLMKLVDVSYYYKCFTLYFNIHYLRDDNFEVWYQLHSFERIYIYIFN